MDKATGIKDKITKTIIDLLMSECRDFELIHVDDEHTTIDLGVKGKIIICNNEYYDLLPTQGHNDGKESTNQTN